ncbi:MAG: hypothetical protein FWE85_03490 [Clostridiales bacterium]|nr:hypothetical protein [Clostridiales bacterium]
MDYKKYVIDFVEGRSNPREFIEYCEKNPQVLDWAQSIASKERKSYKTTDYITNHPYPLIVDEISKDITVWKDSDNNIVAKQEAVPFDINIAWKGWMEHGKSSDSGTQLNVHQGISDIVVEAFPNETINVSKSVRERFNFLLDVLPEYIVGNEAEELVDAIISSLPNDLPKTKRIKEAKEKIKEAFHLGGGKYPRWAQDGEWPFSKTGKPMKFVSQKRKRDPELTEHTFEDVDTGERLVVEDWIS